MLERFGVPSHNVLGVKVPRLREMARAMGKNHPLALELWHCGIHEARILCSMIAAADQMTGNEMNNWVKDIYSWDICDQCCSNLFIKTGHWKEKVYEWIPAGEEFTRRAGVVLIAEAAMHAQGQVADQELLHMLKTALSVADDNRNFVKKAISWAMRQVGKKRQSLIAGVIEMGEELRLSGSASCRWIGSDVVAELRKHNK